MTLVYNDFQNALNGLIRAHFSHRVHLPHQPQAVKDKAGFLRDFGTVRVNIGQRTGKTVWATACANSDWLILSPNDIESMGCDGSVHIVKDKASYTKALNTLVDSEFTTVVVDEPWIIEHNGLDKFYTNLYKALAKSKKPLEQLAVIILG
ncbi:hypothetical protein [Yersinia ruckeri]|uniref:hypothetical protein n=1 Tax=Yersinia ruckeri TaxID=29486 RepID=UPI0022378B57|nr:hypothetical protein [Yersinia ruckeri]MCW6598759.1 hypothetical protein [Yersinia ruckeri]